MAPPTMKSPAIMMTTELENPASPSSGVMTPVSTSATMEQSATTSDRIRPHTSRPAVTMRMISTWTIVNRFLYGGDYSWFSTKIPKMEVPYPNLYYTGAQQTERGSTDIAMPIDPQF